MIEFSSKLGYIKSLVEERINLGLVEEEINLSDNHLVIAELRCRKDTGRGIKEERETYVKVLDIGTIFKVSYTYIANSFSDDIRNISVSRCESEEETLDMLMEQYRAFDDDAVQIDIDYIRSKVVKRNYGKEKELDSITLNF